MNHYRIRDLERDDVAVLNALKPATWGDISAIHEHYLTVKNCHSVAVVDDGGAVAGIGTGISFSGTGWLAHIIVSKDRQRRGLGTMIVEDRLRFLRERMGCDTITLTATDDGYPVYKKVGFSDESMYRVMVKPQNYAFDDAEDDRIVRIGDAHIEDVLRIDRIASGEDRSGLLRPVLKNGYAFVARGSAEGFYLPSFGDGGVSAITEVAGITLLGKRLREDKAIYIPTENGAAYGFLLSRGFSEARQIHRMILGTPFAREPRNCYSRFGGFAG